MSDNDFSGSDAIRKAEDQGLVFSEDKKTLIRCTNEKITEVVIPNSVTKIGSEAFSGCKSLTSVVIPDSVTEISRGAFSDCTSLTSVVIPDSVKKIRANAFESCTSLMSIVIPDSVTAIVEEECDYSWDSNLDGTGPWLCSGGAFEEAGCEEQVSRDYGHLFIKEEYY